jgi:plastocyanin
MPWRRLAFTVLFLALARTDAPAGELAGRIEVTGPSGDRQEPAGIVVWIPGVPVPEAGRASAAMSSRDKRFDPHVLAVPRGSTVAFPNADPVYHNVFSLSPEHAFDLGLYRKGATRSVLFKKPGVVSVYCNIHPEMAGYVVVVDGAFALTGEDGVYRIAGVPAGRHLVRVWSETGGETSATLDFADGRTTRWELSLDGSRYRVRPHKNKHGKDYPPATHDVDRY